LGWHLHNVALLVDDKFGLKAVEPPDAALAVGAGLAVVGAVHRAGSAGAAAAPDGEDSVVARLHPRHASADLNDLAEHLVADHQLRRAVRGARPSPVGFLSIGPTDANLQHLQLDIVRRSQYWRWTIHELNGSCARSQCNRTHGCLPAIVYP